MLIIVAFDACAARSQERWYIFDPPVLHQLAQDAIRGNEGNMTAIISHITTNLAQTHPAYTIVSLLSSLGHVLGPATKTVCKPVGGRLQPS
jgi:hypothetical protein